METLPLFVLLPLLARGVGNTLSALHSILSGSLHPCAFIFARGWRGCGRTPAVDVHVSLSADAVQVDVCLPQQQMPPLAYFHALQVAERYHQSQSHSRNFVRRRPPPSSCSCATINGKTTTRWFSRAPSEIAGTQTILGIGPPQKTCLTS